MSRVSEFYTAKQVAKILGVDVRTLTQWVEDKRFPAPLAPYKKPRRWLRVHVDQWVAEMRDPAREGL